MLHMKSLVEFHQPVVYYTRSEMIRTGVHVGLKYVIVPEYISCVLLALIGVYILFDKKSSSLKEITFRIALSFSLISDQQHSLDLRNRKFSRGSGDHQRLAQLVLLFLSCGYDHACLRDDVCDPV